MQKSYYEAIENEVEVFKTAYNCRLPVLLKGPTGCGKSRFVEYMAQELGLDLISVSCNDDTSAIDLVGRFLLEGGETKWHDGPVTRAVRAGKMIYLDEIAEAREDILTVLHSLSDHRRELYIDRTNESVKANDTFMMVTSFNPGYQMNLKELKPSLRQRFISLNFSYPNKEKEIEIIQKESGCDKAVSDRLVNYGNKVRTLHELGLSETVSTRLLVSAGKLIQSGLEERAACDVAINQSLSDDEETIAALRGIVQMQF